MSELSVADHVIQFEHGIREIEVRSNKKEYVKLQPSTKCTIRSTDGEVITSSTVHLYHKDNNNVRLAMRHSFKKSVNNIQDVNTRRALWEGFKPHIMSGS